MSDRAFTSITLGPGASVIARRADGSTVDALTELNRRAHHDAVRARVVELVQQVKNFATAPCTKPSEPSYSVAHLHLQLGLIDGWCDDVLAMLAMGGEG